MVETEKRAKLDVYRMPRPEMHEERVVLDEDGPPMVFVLRQLDGAEIALASEMAQEMYKTYVTGDDYRPPAPFPDQWVKASLILFINAAIIELSQGGSPEEVYSALEVCVLSTRRPRDYATLAAKIDLLTKRWQQQPGKSPGAPTA